MPPKRKDLPEGKAPEGPPSKKEKKDLPKGSNTKPGEEIKSSRKPSETDVPKPAVTGGDDPEGKIVRWIRPDLRGKTAREQEAVKRCAPMLFHQPYHLLIFDEPRRLSLVPVPSPIHKKISSRSLEKVKDTYHVKNRSSDHLRELYDRIFTMSDTFASTVEWLGSDDFGVLIYDQDGVDPIAVRSDVELHVTLESLGEVVEETSSIRIIRCQIPSESFHEHFIVLSPGRSVTVNGTTYGNTKDEGEIVIGPLDRFAIIELLSAPIFLWRSQADASPTGTVKSVKATCSDAEAGIRHIRGDDIVRVTINVNPVTSKPDTTKAIKAGGKPDDTKGPDTVKSSGVSGTDPPKPDGGHPGDDSRGGKTPPVMTGSPTPEQIEDTILPVIFAINSSRTDESMRLCVDACNILTHAGRPWILPLRLSDTTVLLVVQIRVTKEKRFKTRIHVLDPREWRSTRATRDAVWSIASGSTILQRWLPGLGLAVQEIPSALPVCAYWVGSPAAYSDYESIVVTILNAWALAMGLTPNPEWVFPDRTTSSDGPTLTGSTVGESDLREAFLKDAEGLFRRVRLGQEVNWRSIYDFLSRSGFILGSDPPTEDRRIDLRSEVVETLKEEVSLQERRRLDRIKTQLSSGSSSIEVLLTADKRKILSSQERIAVQLPEGRRRHSLKFPSDGQSESEREFEYRTLVLTRKWAKQIQKKFTDLNDDRSTPGLVKVPDPKEPKSSSAELKITLDTTDLDGGFNPCKHLQESLAKFKKWSKAKKVPLIDPSQISEERVQQSIAAVIQAVGHVTTRNPIFEQIKYNGNSYEKIERREINDAKYRKNGLLILPWASINSSTNSATLARQFRSILVAVQVKERDSPKGFRIHMFDHAPWLADPEERENTFQNVSELIRRMHPSKSGIRSENNTVVWWKCSRPNASQLWQLRYFTILDAWAIALGLELNPDFHANKDFFAQAEQVVRLVLLGIADWKLLFAFLKCQRYVTINIEARQDRRFRRTVSRDELSKSLRKLHKEDTHGEYVAEYTAKDSFFRKPISRSDFPMDEWQLSKIPSSEQIIDSLLRANKLNPDLTRDGLLQTYKKWIELLEKPTPEGPPTTTAPPPEKPSPCKVFDNEMKEIFEKHSSRIDKWISKRTPRGEWIWTQEALWPIAAVTLAITSAQNDERGYSCSRSHWLEAMVGSAEPIETRIGPFMRPLRPLLMPICWRSHMVLAIVQLNGTGQPCICVLDSRPQHWGNSDRHAIYDGLAAVIPFWSMSGLLSSPLNIPECATNIACAPQNTGWTCGYHTIFNAWAIALGLKLNLRFLRKDWEGAEALKFFQMVQRTIAVACLGLATPDFIHHFLECIGFVEAGQTLHDHKKFRHTLLVEDDTTLHLAMDKLAKDDELVHADKVLAKIKGSSDISGLVVTNGDSYNVTYKELVKLFQKKYGTKKIWEYLNNKELYHELLLASWAMERFRKNVKVRLHMTFPKIEESLGMNHLTWAIAAVVQAVNQKQAEREPDKIFRGGFALGGDTIEHNSDLVLAKDGEPGASGVVSRPRRCFPMPFITSDGKHAHDLLVLVQEEQTRKEGGRHICVYVLDTRSDMFRRNLDKYVRSIQQVLDKMLWRIGGKNSGSVTFRDMPRFVRVAPQHGNTVCGFHVILNAWIIALGLTPNPRADFRNWYGEIQRFVQIAVAGVLNWRSLVEWLIHRDYVRETNIELVPRDRRFQATVLQSKTGYLQKELEAIFQAQQLLDDYQFDNNVDFSKPNWEFEPGSELDPDGPALERALEDLDGLSMHEWSNSSEYIQELVALAQKTRRKAKRCIWRSKSLQQNKSRRHAR